MLTPGCSPAQVNAIAGGGASSETKEDKLDKCKFGSSRDAEAGHVLLIYIAAIDWVQENILGQGKQDNESATEQFKDEQMSDFLRREYKNTTGSDFFVKDK